MDRVGYYNKAVIFDAYHISIHYCPMLLPTCDDLALVCLKLVCCFKLMGQLVERHGTEHS
jgi:hypothetical protein